MAKSRLSKRTKKTQSTEESDSDYQEPTSPQQVESPRPSSTNRPTEMILKAVEEIEAKYSQRDKNGSEADVLKQIAAQLQSENAQWDEDDEADSTAVRRDEDDRVDIIADVLKQIAAQVQSENAQWDEDDEADSTADVLKQIAAQLQSENAQRDEDDEADSTADHEKERQRQLERDDQLIRQQFRKQQAETVPIHVAMPYKCRVIGCGNACKTAASLSKHKRKHTQGQIPTCDNCNTTYQNHCLLSRHRGRIHGDYTLKCKHGCEDTYFGTLPDLREHLQSHHGIEGQY